MIGETAVVGDDCTIYQGVTLGGTRLYKGAKRHPTLGRGVVVGAGAQVLGGFTVGDGARIGSNAVVVKPVPAGATAVGNPARVIEQKEDTQSSNPAVKTAESPCSDQTTLHSAGSTAGHAVGHAVGNQAGHQATSHTPTSPTRSPCDSDWNAAPLQEILNKGKATPQPEQTTQDANSEGNFSAYAVDPGASDPLLKVLQELITHTAEQDVRIAQLCKAIESMGSKVDGQTTTIDAQRLNKMVDE